MENTLSMTQLACHRKMNCTFVCLALLISTQIHIFLSLWAIFYHIAKQIMLNRLIWCIRISGVVQSAFTHTCAQAFFSFSTLWLCVSQWFSVELNRFVRLCVVFCLITLSNVIVKNFAAAVRNVLRIATLNALRRFVTPIVSDPAQEQKNVALFNI